MVARALNSARVQMLCRWLRAGDVVVDVGIGAGTFIKSAGANVHGYDVNQRGIEWLRERNLYLDPYTRQVDVACFWDALEHIANPTPLLNNVRRVVLVSLPVFRDSSHVRASKHYKPGEHLWYFTDAGIQWFMEYHGFRIVEWNQAEKDCGREDIFSYAFERCA
jgi:ubiquinone/menaquinone biosynthesis C-methylase UbiE